MARQVSSILGTTSDVLRDAGVFDPYLDLDSKLHIDPHLLESSNHAEMRAVHNSFRDHFANILPLIDHISVKGDPFWNEAHKRLTFPEPPSIALGYSQGANGGRGVGPKLAGEILDTAIRIVRAGTRDPAIFELVGLFQDKVGADLVSDMCCNIGERHFFEFTDRIIKELGLKVPICNTRFGDLHIPIHPSTGEPCLLVASDVLRDLPVALDWSDVDAVCDASIRARTHVNELIGATWKKAKRESKQAIRNVLIEYPEVFARLLRIYNQKSASSYDLDFDPLGEVRWGEDARTAAEQFPLQLTAVQRQDPLQIVRALIEHFKQLVEENGLWLLIHDRRERYAQRLFFGIASSYCEANDLDLSPEVNSGSGAVDFKISRGSKARYVVELKLSDNRKLRHGYEKQVERYRKAEKSHAEFYVVILNKPAPRQLDDIERQNSESLRLGLRCPELHIIDAQERDSASRD